MRALIVVVRLLSNHALCQAKAHQASSLEQVRSALKSENSVDIGSIHLNAAELVMEVNVPRNRVLMIVKGTSGGVLALFDSRGGLSDSVQVGAIVSSQVFGLGEDDLDGIALDEVEGSGTGILLRDFKLYSFTEADKIREIWHAPSFSRKAPWEGDAQVRVKIERGYLAFSRSGAGFPQQMSYAFCDSKGRWVTKLYKLSRGRVEQMQ